MKESQTAIFRLITNDWSVNIQTCFSDFKSTHSLFVRRKLNVASLFIYFFQSAASAVIQMISGTNNYLDMFNIWACHWEVGICQMVKTALKWIVKHQFIPWSNILILNQQEVINVSKCLIHIIITVGCSGLFGPLSWAAVSTPGLLFLSWDTLRIPGSSYIKGDPHSSTPLPFSMHRVSILISWLIV